LHSRKGREGAGIPGAVGVVAGKGLDEDLGSGQAQGGGGRLVVAHAQEKKNNKQLV